MLLVGTHGEQGHVNVHDFELVQDGIIVVGVGQNKLVLELGLDEIFV